MKIGIHLIIEAGLAAMVDHILPPFQIIDPSIHPCIAVWFSSTKLAELALIMMCVDKKKYEGFGRHM